MSAMPFLNEGPETSNARVMLLVIHGTRHANQAWFDDAVNLVKMSPPQQVLGETKQGRIEDGYMCVETKKIRAKAKRNRARSENS